MDINRERINEFIESNPQYSQAIRAFFSHEFYDHFPIGAVLVNKSTNSVYKIISIPENGKSTRAYLINMISGRVWSNHSFEVLFDSDHSNHVALIEKNVAALFHIVSVEEINESIKFCVHKYGSIKEDSND